MQAVVEVVAAGRQEVPFRANNIITKTIVTARKLPNTSKIAAFSILLFIAFTPDNIIKWLRLAGNALPDYLRPVGWYIISPNLE